MQVISSGNEFIITLTDYLVKVKANYNFTEITITKRRSNHIRRVTISQNTTMLTYSMQMVVSSIYAVIQHWLYPRQSSIYEVMINCNRCISEYDRVYTINMPLE